MLCDVPAPGLVDVDDELVAELAGEDLVGRLDDGVGDGRVEAPERAVGARARLLDEHRGGDERRRAPSGR